MPPEPGNRSTNLSPGTAPRSRNSQAQNAAGFAPMTRAGSVSQVTPKVIEGLFAADLAFLQEFYNRINRNGKPELDAVCPKCSQQFAVEMQGAGGL